MSDIMSDGSGSLTPPHASQQQQQSAQPQPLDSTSLPQNPPSQVQPTNHLPAPPLHPPQLTQIRSTTSPGTKIVGGYALQSKLGSGSFATVYLGHATEGGREEKVAIKAIKSSRLTKKVQGENKRGCANRLNEFVRARCLSRNPYL